MADRQQVYEAIRRADAAGDRASVERLGRYLQEMDKPKSPQSTWQQLKSATGNVIAGGIEGVAAIPDAVTEAIAGTMRSVTNPAARMASAIYRGIGMPGAADRVEANRRVFDQGLSRPATVARGIQAIVPVPKDTAGQIARIGAGFVGGAMVPMGPKITPPARFPRAAVPRKNAPNLDLIRAGERQKIPVRRPDARPDLRGDMAAAEASPYAGGHVARTLAADRELMQARLGQVGGPGRVQSESYNLGKQIQKVGTDYIERTGKHARKAYEQVDELAGGKRISPTSAVAQIDNNIAELESAPFVNSATIDYLRGVRGDLVKKADGFSVKEFQALRSAARKKISGSPELTATDAERRLGNVVRSFSEDARTQLPKEASDLLDQTDAFYADRMGFIKEVLQKDVLGRRNNPLSAEKAAARMQALAKNQADFDKFNRFWGVADPQTQADFAASFTSNLGTKGDKFGLGTLASDIEAVPPNIRQTIYGDRAPDLADLQMLARAKEGTAGGLNNSRSGVVTARDIAKRIVPAAGAGLIAGGPMGAAASMAVMEGGAAANQFYNASRLLNPNWAKALTEQAAPSLMDTAAPYAPRMMAPAANYADELGGLLGQRFIPSLAADDERGRKKKKNQR